MKIKLLILTVVIQIVLLTGCATTQLTAPCPNFGAHCAKVPLNSWDYQHS